MSTYFDVPVVMDDYTGFSHVLDSLNVLAQLPFQLIPDHWFRRAEPQEVDRIRQQLATQPQADFIYDYAFTMSPDGRTVGHKLPPDQWRYYVISYSPDHRKMIYLEYAADLLKNDITLGYSFYKKSGISYNPYQISTFFHDPDQLIDGHYFYNDPIELPKSITDQDLGQITTNYGLITALDDIRYPNVSRAVADFHQTKAITNTVPL
jgi:hypothetical protein